MDDVLKRAIGVVAAVAGTAGAYTLGVRSRRREDAGHVFWVGPRFDGNETTVVDARALETLIPVTGPLTERNSTLGQSLGGVFVRIQRRGRDAGGDDAMSPQRAQRSFDAFGPVSYVIEPAYEPGEDILTRRQAQKSITGYLRDLVLLGVLDEGGWFESWTLESKKTAIKRNL